MLSSIEQAEYRQLFANKKQEALIGVKDPNFDKDPLFLEAIERLNQLDFAYTTGSCSGHVENPLGDPFDHVRPAPGKMILPGVAKEKGLVRAPQGKQLVIFGFVAVELDRLNTRSGQLVERATGLTRSFANLQIRSNDLSHLGNTSSGEPVFSQGLLLRLQPPAGLPDTGYSRYDFFNLYLADNPVARQFQSQFQDFWGAIAGVAASI